MNQNAFLKVREVLPTGSGQHSINGTSLESILSQTRVTPSTQLPPMKHLFTFYGTPCFYRGELVAVCGRAKSGKTLFLSAIMACCLTQKVLALERTKTTDKTDSQSPTDDAGTKSYRVLWLDTEQSAQSTQDILVHRIMPLTCQCTDMDEHFYAFNLRGYGYESRKAVMEYSINLLKPDLVVIDGIKDLVTDINDAVQATLIMEQLMALAQKNNCCIVNVLHMNKSEPDKNMRGSIGTELTNKAFEVFQCEYIEESDRFKVNHALSRKQRCKRKMYYILNDNNLPIECEEQPRDAQGRWTSSKPKQTVTPEVKWERLNRKYIEDRADGSFSWKISPLFEDAFEGYRVRPFNQVMAATLRLTHIEDVRVYYTLFNEAERQGVIKKTQHPETGDTWVELNNGLLPLK